MKITAMAIVATAALGLMTQAQARNDHQPRTDTSVAANSTAPVAKASTASGLSNWPALPERQAGRSYGQLVHTTSGIRERNFESGR